MADNEQQMVLVAKLVDQVSDRLKEINKAMLTTESAARKAHHGAAESADLHRRSIELLHKSMEQIKDVSGELLKPAFASLGLSAFSIAGAVSAVVDAVKSLGEEGLALEKVHQRTGMLSNSIREIQGLGQRWGVSFGETNEGLSQFGDLMARTSRLAPEALRQWQQMPGAFELLGSKLMGLKNPKEQFDRTMDFVVRMPLVDQRRRLLAMLGLPQDLAYYTKDTLDEARRAEQEWTRSHPFAADIAKKADENFTAIGRSLQGLKNDLAAAFGGQVLEGVEAVNHFLENPQNIERIKEGFNGLNDIIMTDMRDLRGLIDLMKSLWNWAPAEWMKKTPSELFQPRKDTERTQPKPFVPFMAKPLGLYKPTSFGDGIGSSSETSHYIEEPMYRAMFQALQDWYRSLTGQGGGSGGGAGGIMNANFGGSSGAASAQFGNKDYPNIGGGGGGGGTDLDTIMKGYKSGSTADNVSGGPFDRTRFREELKQKPWLVNKLMRIAANEQGSNPAGTQGVIEETMNRAAMRGTSLEKEARWTSEHGYYQNGSMGRGALENSKHRAILEQGLRNALGGANTIDFATDNSSGGLAQRERSSGKFIFHKRINGESFFHPGRAEAVHQKRWNAMIAKQRDFELAKKGSPTDSAAKFGSGDFGSSGGAAATDWKSNDWSWMRRSGNILDRRGVRGGIRKALSSRGTAADFLLDDFLSGEDGGNSRLGKALGSGDLDRRQTDGRLLLDANKAVGSGGQNKDPNASVSIDFKNMPSWVKSNTDHNGMFKEFKVNRGFQMPLASEQD